MEENNTRLIQTLIRGRESTKRLQGLLHRKVNLDGPLSAEHLLMEILGSFSTGISMLNSSLSGEIYGVPAASPVENIPEVYAGKKPAPAVRERRGCYKRRRTIESSVKISGSIEDGFSWRKYGQKEILNSKSPRCYFRCTHKNGHGCKALKQVQKFEDESNRYHITYLGRHTCPSFTNREVLLDFNNHHYQQVPNSPSIITNVHIDPSVKQEVVDSKDQSTTDVSDIVSSANDENTSSQALRWDEVLRFDHDDSSASTTSHDYLINSMGFFSTEDLLNGMKFIL